MVSINKRGIQTVKRPGSTPLKTVAKDTVTYEGAPAATRDSKSELFLMAVSGFYGEETFYESGADRTERFKRLVRVVAEEDPQWMLGFVPWLRGKANIRTAAIVAAIEAARVMRRPGTKGQPDPLGSAVGHSRRVLQLLFESGRPDEPAETLAYWLTTYGRPIPSAITRGIGDGAVMLYNERAFIKSDGDGKSIRMGDVVDMTRPTPNSHVQNVLFKYMIDSRHRPTEIPAELSMLTARRRLLDLSDKEKQHFLNDEHFHAVIQQLREVGMTWEQVSSWGAFTATTWQRMIPIMDYMALLRNLRNFQEAGIDAEMTASVINKLSNEYEVSKSRQLPYRFYSAYVNATSAQWHQALETALQHSLANVPELLGKTLILVDTSASMGSMTFSAKSRITPMMAGALFGVALAAKNGRADLIGFADNTFVHRVSRGASVLRETDRFVAREGEVGHGTQTAFALRSSYKDHDRVIIVTDGQTFGIDRHGFVGDVGAQIPQTVPIYAFNLNGYKPAMMETTSTRHELGGLTDHTFSMIKLVEAGQQAKWPWEPTSA